MHRRRSLRQEGPGACSQSFSGRDCRGAPGSWTALAAAALVALVLLPAPAQAVVGTPVELSSPSPQVRIAGSGWGHSVGMSQYGAHAQALVGWSADRILRYWYRGVTIGRSSASREPITVNLSTAARSPGVVIQSGTGEWQVCTPRCRWLMGRNGNRLIQRPDSGTWTVVATAGGGLSLRRNGTALWSGTTNATLRVQLSPNASERTVARVLGHRYRWGTLQFGAYADAACRGPALCVNLRVPSVERYLYGLAEMPSSWARPALSAQAIVGRTYALRMAAKGLRAGCRCHLLSTPADQVYQGLAKEEGFSGERWVDQVNASARKVVRHRGGLAATFYSSSHGGRSERIADSYAYSAPQSAYPYLTSVDDPWSKDSAVHNPYAAWTTTVSNTAFARSVDARLRRVTGISVQSRTAGGTPRRLRVSGTDASGRSLVVSYDGTAPKQIAGAALKQRFALRSQQIIRLGLGPYGDDDGNVHEYAIATLAAADVTAGCADDRFCPTAVVSRAQTATLLARSLQLPDAQTDAFADDGESVHQTSINALADAGLASGCRPGNFCPGAMLTRAQMAALLGRALELPPATVDAFDDDDGTAHEDSINRLAAAGITAGSARGGFHPAGRVTRAQLASFVVRALNAVR